MSDEDDRRLDRARTAAGAFCLEFDFPVEALRELETAPPLLGPVTIEKDGRSVTAYRWLGSGRGSDYVQVEVDDETESVVVHGARGDAEYGPWSPSS